MLKIDKSQIKHIASLFADCFIDDELTQLQLKGIENNKVFLENLFYFQLSVFHRTIDVLSVDENLNSVIIGYEKKKYKAYKVLMLSLLSSFRVLRLAGIRNFSIYSRNLRNVSRFIDLQWQEQYIAGNYYHVNAIAISTEERGKGIFRSLITPVIDNCNDLKIPIILESSNSDTIPIYEHFGFELVRTISNKDVGVCQYCFIKNPI